MPVGDETFNPPPGYTGPPATGGGPNVPPAAADWNRDQWWTTPDLLWDTPTSAFAQGGQIASPELPGWAATPGQYLNAQTFYGDYWGQPPDLRDTWLSGIQSTGSAHLATQAARDAALGSLGQAMSGLSADREAWENDPYRRMVMESLGGLATAERGVFSEREEAAKRLEIAQTVAANMAQVQARAAGRGVASGGATGGIQAGIRSGGAAAGTQLGAVVDAANQEGRIRALSSLGRLTGAFEQLDKSYIDAGNLLTQHKAQMEADVDYIPQDVWAFEALASERERYEEALQMEQDALAAWQESQELDWTDYVDLISIFA